MKHAAKRMILICPGKPKRSVVVVNPPYPEVGWRTQIDGDVYKVAELRDETVLFSVSFRKKPASQS